MKLKNAGVKTKKCILAFFFSLFCLGICLSAEANDFSQRWTHLRVHPAVDPDKGYQGGSGPEIIWMHGPWQAVDVIGTYIRDLHQAGFGFSEDLLLALRDLADARSLPTLLNYTLSESPGTTAETLGLIGESAAIPALLKLLDNEDAQMRALIALAQIGNPSVVPALIRQGEKILPEVESPFVGKGPFLNHLCVALGVLGDPQAIPFLHKVLKYPYPYEDELQGVQKGASWALAMLGDRSQIKTFLQFKNDFNALKTLKHPAALQIAQTYLGEEDDRDQMGAHLVAALAIYAEMGQPQDIPYLKQKEREWKKNGVMSTVTGDGYPLSNGAIVVEPEVLHVLFAWPQAALGDSSSRALLEQELQAKDPLVSASAARFLLRLGRQDLYPEVVKHLRTFFQRRDYGCKTLPRQDRGISARIEILQSLGKAASPEALESLVQLLNDCNPNAVAAARLALKKYPVSQRVAALKRQYLQAQEWELWQLATGLEMAGPEGYRALGELFKGSSEPWQQMVAARVLVRLQQGQWRKTLCQAWQKSQGSHPAYQDFRDWVPYYFQFAEPGIENTCV